VCVCMCVCVYVCVCERERERSGRSAAADDASDFPKYLRDGTLPCISVRYSSLSSLLI